MRMEMIVSQSDVDFWVPERETSLLSHHDVVRHVAWVKANHPDLSLEDIGEPLTITKSRVQEIMADPDTRLQYPYLMRVTAAAKRMYPDGVPMLREYRVRGDSPEEALDRAFGPRSVPAQQQRLIPAPEPIAVRDGDLGRGKPRIEGDIDFDPDDPDLTPDDYRTYIYRLETEVRQWEGRANEAYRVLSDMKGKEAELRATLRDISSMNAATAKQLTEANATIKQLVLDLLEAQKAIEAHAAFRDTLRKMVDDEQ